MTAATVEDDPLSRLLDRSDAAVICDGLRVSEHHDGYTVSVPGETRGRLNRDAATRFLRDHPDYVTNWRYWADVGDRTSARRAFLRWVERADERGVPERYAALDADTDETAEQSHGVERSWGELLVRVRWADRERGERRYELRHLADAGVPRADLDERDDPREAREISKFDERGRYRPLSTAPTLARGWVFAALSGAELVRAVDFFYPATVANWQRERRGDLDVTHYRETADRQTGIYELVGELSTESVGHLAASCCVDSQCLKRREWGADAETPLDVPRGDGPFPCREPCSLVIAAARTFATLESEDTREYTFELTPSEKNQLEEIVDAVAEGHTAEILEADLGEGANRYRARYLRAKRFTERGLGDVPTFEEE